MRSIIPQNDGCFRCGSMRWLEEHHIFGGADRKKSEKYGLKVTLCHWCHNEPPEGAHHNRAFMQYLHEIGQQAFEKTHSRERFVAEFGKNYL